MMGNRCTLVASLMTLAVTPEEKNAVEERALFLVRATAGGRPALGDKEA